MRLGKFFLLAVTGSSGAYIGQKVYKDGRFDSNNFGVIRFGRAALAVGKIGFDYQRTLYSTTHGSPDEYEEAKSKAHDRSAQTLLELCYKNGGCFTKVGQHIGALDYLLPEEYVTKFKVLHSNAPKMDMDDINAVLHEHLGADPSEIFIDFEEEPLGTASLAQVHKAKLKESGEEVAVKVQHRYVKQHSFVDIYTMDFLVRVVNWVFPKFEFMWLAEEMRKNLPLELDFRQEGKNAEKVSKMYANYDWLKVPKIFWTLTSDRILVMEYCSGGHIDDKKYIEQNGIDRSLLSKRVGQMYADMIFHHGFVHCDPHPGNVLVRKNKNGNDEVVLLDHGLYTQLTDKFRLDYSQFWSSILKADEDGMQKNADRLGVGELYGLFACMVTGRSWNSIRKGIDKSEKNAAESKEVKENVAKYIKWIADVLAKIDRQMILIFKTNDLLRNIEFSLGTHNNKTSFVQMTKTCMQVVRAEEMRVCQTKWCYFKTSIKSILDQLKITFYQIHLWLWWSYLGRRIRGC